MVYPGGVRDEYTSIVFLEPFDVRNRQAFGFDMFQNNIRREAMLRASRTGGAAMSGKVTLVQEIDGYVYSLFRMDNFIGKVFTKMSHGIKFNIYDGHLLDSINEFNVMYKGISDINLNNMADVKVMNFGGESWVFKFVTHSKLFGSQFANWLLYIIWLSGIILALIAYFLVYMFLNRSISIKKQVAQKTDDLQKRIKEKEKISNELEVANKKLEKKASELDKKVLSLWMHKFVLYI